MKVPLMTSGPVRFWTGLERSACCLCRSISLMSKLWNSKLTRPYSQVLRVYKFSRLAGNRVYSDCLPHSAPSAFARPQ